MVQYRSADTEPFFVGIDTNSYGPFCSEHRFESSAIVSFIRSVNSPASKNVPLQDVHSS